MADAVNLVILGASGDLTRRLLLPGLGTLLTAEPKRAVHLIGAAADELTQQQWQQRVAEALRDGGSDARAIDTLIAATTYARMDATSADDLGTLLGGLTGPVVLYFALPPAISMKTCEALSRLTLPDQLSLAIEKPFGTDPSSAQRFNRLLTGLVPENRVFRVDHFLGKSTILNLLGLRFTNRFFEPVWNRENVDRIEIVADETLALEGRAGYYDHSGALKDMIQSHLLLVMALLCMEPPNRIAAEDLRSLQADVLRATRLWQDDPVQASRRARYTAGRIDGRDVPDYVDEPGVDPARCTETLAEVTVEIHSARWHGVPIRLRSGKALGDGVRAISVVFQNAFQPEGFHDQAQPNVVVIGMADESLQVRVNTNGADDKFTLEETVLSADLGDSPIRPYGEILAHIMDADPLLSVRGDVAEDCWRILGPVLDAWNADRVPLDEYRAGSSGPTNWN
ncbi:MAG: glucose-6-phosphate dehydrogenase [Micropruina sp.]|nr:glucose-6-phosphate dehydrogenase [Micropruina sp.]